TPSPGRRAIWNLCSRNRTSATRTSPRWSVIRTRFSAERYTIRWSTGWRAVCVARGRGCCDSIFGEWAAVRASPGIWGVRWEMEAMYESFAEPKGLHWIEAGDHFFVGALDALEETVIVTAGNVSWT